MKATSYKILIKEKNETLEFQQIPWQENHIVTLLPNFVMNCTNVRTRMLEHKARELMFLEFVNLEINNVSINSWLRV